MTRTLTDHFTLCWVCHSVGLAYMAPKISSHLSLSSPSPPSSYSPYQARAQPGKVGYALATLPSKLCVSVRACVCFCPVLSCPVLSCPVLSCPVLSCPVLSWPGLAWPGLAWPGLAWPAGLAWPGLAWPGLAGWLSVCLSVGRSLCQFVCMG